MFAFAEATWRLRTQTVDTRDHTLIMGVVNVTPDSFSDGGSFPAADGVGSIDHDAAIEHGRRLVGDGADIIDVGGESTRPGAEAVDVAEELHRVVPVVEVLAAEGIIVSVDTSKAEVAEAALLAGAEIVNDVTGLRDPAMVEVCAALGPGVVIMHMCGDPRSMQDAPHYDDVVDEVRDYLVTQGDAAIAVGIDPARLCLDPGIGFGKTVSHNLELLAGLGVITAAGYPVLIGTSRKSFLGVVLGRAGRLTAPPDRDGASAATAALAVAAGASIVRAHNVAATLESTRIADAIVRSATNVI